MFPTTVTQCPNSCIQCFSQWMQECAIYPLHHSVLLLCPHSGNYVLVSITLSVHQHSPGLWHSLCTSGPRFTPWNASSCTGWVLNSIHHFFPTFLVDQYPGENSDTFHYTTNFGVMGRLANHVTYSTFTSNSLYYKQWTQHQSLWHTSSHRPVDWKKKINGHPLPPTTNQFLYQIG